MEADDLLPSLFFYLLQISKRNSLEFPFYDITYTTNALFSLSKLYICPINHQKMR